MKTIISAVIVAALLIGSSTVFSQGVAINDDGSTPTAGAMLDIKSTTGGLLIPRMTTAERNAISSKPHSVLIYQTDGDSGFYYYHQPDDQWYPFLSDGAGDNSGWTTEGNAGTNPNTNFIGTTDANDWVIRTNNSERARITSDGRIGIGTNTPSGLSALHVVSSTDSTQFVKFDHTGSSNTTLWLGDPNTISNETGLYMRSSTKGHLGTAGGAIIFNIGSSERARINTGNGNVGINETDPQQKLHVSGNALLESTGPILYLKDNDATLNSNTNHNNIRFIDQNDDLTGLIGYSTSFQGMSINNLHSNGYIVFSTGNGPTERMRIDSVGNVGIGNHIPIAQLHVEDGTAGSLLLNLRNSTDLANLFVTTSPSQTNVFSGGSDHLAFSSNNDPANPDIYIHGTTRNVGINETSPAQKLHVSGDAILEDTSPILYLKDNDATLNTNGQHNNIRFIDQNDNLNGFLGFSTSAQGFSIQNYNTAGTIHFSTGGITNAMILNSSGNVSIGTLSTTVTEKLVVAGNIAPGSNNTYDLGTSSLRWRDIYTVGAVNTSDKRLKKNITELDYGLQEVMNLEPVSYQWKENNNGTRLGFLAQDVLKVLPETVKIGDDKNKTLGVRYSDIIPVLTKAIQEQQQVIENLTTKNSTQDDQINSLKAEIDRINAILEGKASK